MSGPWAPKGFEVTLSKRFFVKDGHTLETYKKDGGYEGLRKVLKMPTDEVIDTVKKSNLRGRGGAGFPAGMKWSFVPKQSDKPKYFVVNGDESEPGTYKDRYTLARDPHSMLEGSAIGAYAIGAHTIYVYLRGEFGLPYRRLEAAVKEAYDAGIFGESAMGSGYKLDVYVHRGAGAYICGEETALLESLEGKIGRPRLKPPFPAVVGAFGGPTIINNVETMACVPLIFTRGVEWFNAQGSPQNGGPKLICVSGHVERPGVYEVPNGYPMDKFIELAGGVWKGRKLKAVIPGGSSTPILVPRPCKALAKEGAPESEWPLETQVPMDLDNIRKAGSMFGSAAMIVMDDQTCMVRSLATLANFYAHESCGQCTPCREGTGWAAKMLNRLEAGKANDADLATLEALGGYMSGTTICPLADALSMPVMSYLAKFRQEFVDHIKKGGCSYPQAAVSPCGDSTWEDAR
jgi:NADH-quinone oxidoreductase subunit F